MAKRPTVSIVGCGRVGGAIGLALKRAGYTIGAAWSHSRAGRQRAHRLLDVPVLETPGEVAHEADVTFVAVPDDAIANIAREIADGVRPGSHVVHTSGGTSIEALAPVRDKGARIGSVHPLQTLPGPDHEALRGAGVAVTCGPEDRPILERLARAWGGRPFALDDDAKPIYHAAAVLASNYLVASIWAATQLFESLGIPNGRGALTPLVRTSIENVLRNGPRKAITGPVVRGDIATVRRHIKALGGNPIGDAYRAMAKLTAALAGTELTT